MAATLSPQQLRPRADDQPQNALDEDALPCAPLSAAATALALAPAFARTPSPSGAAAARRGTARRSGSASGCATSQRLDVLEARVLSNWHEFLVHQQEAQLKFEELFASLRSGARPRGHAAVQAVGLEKRVEACEQGLRDSSDTNANVRRQLAELRCMAHDNRQSAENFSSCAALAGREAAEAFRIMGDLHSEVRGMDELQAGLRQALEARIDRIQFDFQDALLRSHREVSEITDSKCAEMDGQLRRCEVQIAGTMSTHGTNLENHIERYHGETELAKVVAAAALERRLLEHRTETHALMEQRARRSHVEVNELAENAEVFANATLERRLLDHRTEVQTLMEQRARRSQLEVNEMAEHVEVFATAALERRLLEHRTETQAVLEQYANRSHVEATEIVGTVETASQKWAHQFNAQERRLAVATEEALECRLRQFRHKSAEDLQSLKASVDHRSAMELSEAARADQNLEAWVDQCMRKCRSELREATTHTEDLAMATVDRCLRKNLGDAEERLAAVQKEIVNRTKALEDRVNVELGACGRQFTKCGEELRDAIDESMARSNSLARRVFEAHGTANEAHEVARGISNRFHDDWRNDGLLAKTSTDATKYSARNISRVERTTLEVAERSANLNSVIQGLKEDFRQLRGDVNLLKESQKFPKLCGSVGSSEGRTSLGNIDLEEELRQLRHDMKWIKRSETPPKLRANVNSGEGGGFNANAICADSAATRNELDEHLFRITRLEQQLPEAMRRRGSPNNCRDTRLGHLSSDTRPTLGGQFATSFSGTGEETWNAMADNAVTTARNAMVRVDDISSQLVKIRQEVRDESGRAEQIARRIARTEIDRRVSEAQWVFDQRHEKLARSLEQQRLSDGSQRAEIWRDLQEIRNLVGELKLKNGGGTSLLDAASL